MRNSHPPTTERKLKDLARELASRSGVDWNILVDQCSEFIVFGSQATGFQTRSSDLDVLLVGTHSIELPCVTRMDLMLLTEREILSPNWLKSELAGHIAVYGRWLRGASRWRMKALELLGKSSYAAEAKRRRIERLINGLRKHWDRLTPDFRRSNLLTLRREKQRHELLRLGFAVPPTRLLDIWAAGDAFPDGVDRDELSYHFAQIAREAEFPPRAVPHRLGGSVRVRS